MEILLQALTGPWPWYVAGPIIGLMVPVMLLIGSRSFGISQNLEHICAITQPTVIDVHFFRYDWKASAWSLAFTAGVILGGLLAGVIFRNPEAVALSGAALEMFAAWGLAPSQGLVPPELFDISRTWNAVILVVGGIMVGFGTRYAAGCTSGHAITGLATLQPQSLSAVLGIFGGGLLASHLLVPFLV